MEHVAIMKKSWGLTAKILTGQKKIESRWYNVKYPPWNRINIGDVIYFKDSGEPVSIKAETKKVIQISDLTPNRVKTILDKYSRDDGIDLDDISEFYELFKDKKYCMLIYLKNPQRIEPFDINKKGFGMMSAWITIDSVDKIRLKRLIAKHG